MQEVKKVYSPVSSGEEDKLDEEGNPVYMGVAKEAFIPVLVKAIQELSAKVEALENA